MASHKKKKNDKKDVNHLKKDIETDDHIISLDELYLRLETDPDKGITPEEAEFRFGFRN